jgi:Spy/CpxP family protein refolding chaperone
MTRSRSLPLVSRAVLFGAAAAALLAGAAAPTAAQNPADDDPLARVLFAPELLMQHRRAIELTDEQRDAASRLIQDLQGRVVSLQWELLDEMESLNEILEGPRVDLDRALDRFSEVLDKEDEIKRLHLELLVRLKNLLTPEQQEELARLRDEGDGG